MPTSLEITVEQLGKFFAGKAAQAQTLDLSVPMRIIAELVKSSIKKNFATGAAPDGTPWLPLKRPRQGKRHKGSSAQPLRDTGLLMASVTSAGPHHLETIGSNFLEIGTNLVYAGVHQFGATINQAERHRRKPWVFTNEQGATIFTRRIRAHTVRLPARPFLGFSDELVQDISDVLGEALEKALWP
jgi:phage virion morphogenesis protein